MNNDTLRTIFTYVTALVVIVGGGALIVIPTQLDPNTLLPFLTGAIGTVLGYVFGERTASSAVANQPTVVTSAGPPATTTIAPSQPEPTTWDSTRDFGDVPPNLNTRGDAP